MLSILLGIYLFFAPGIALLAWIWYIAFYAFLSGIGFIAFALRLKDLATEWAALIFLRVLINTYAICQRKRRYVCIKTCTVLANRCVLGLVIASVWKALAVPVLCPRFHGLVKPISVRTCLCENSTELSVAAYIFAGLTLSLQSPRLTNRGCAVMVSLRCNSSDVASRALSTTQ